MAGDWAFHLSEYVLKIMPKGDGEAMEERGKIIVIYQRQPDGS